MADVVLIDGQWKQVNDQPRQIDLMRGIGLPPNLDAAEASSWRRYLPKSTPWPRVVEFEDQVVELDQLRDELTAELTALTEQRQAAPAQDAEALAVWELDGAKGSRPEPTAPALDANIKSRQERIEGLFRAIDKVTAARADYVEKHRDRLTRDARRGVEEARARAARALAEFDEAREDLVEARRTEIWSLFYPSSEARSEPNWAALGGGLKRILETLGTPNIVPMPQVLAALREDVEWAATATTREQRAAKSSSDARRPGEPHLNPRRDAAIDAEYALAKHLGSS